MALVQMLLLSMLSGIATTDDGATGGEFCQFDVFEASCPGGVVEMGSALYGRMHLGKCVTSDLGFVGCSSDVLDVLDNKCSGRRECSISIPDKALAQRQSCLTELTMYLEANYTCRSVIGIDTRNCQNCDYVRITEPEGSIASVTTRESGCGSPECPWLIEAQPGQQINISLVNYGWTRDGRQKGEHSCQVYATVKEVTTAKTETLCAENARDSHVYLSLTHSVELRVVARGDSKTRHSAPQTEFLLHYQFLGCPDPAPPEGGWVSRDGDVITLGCNNTGDRWQQRCVGGMWDGKPPSCPGYNMKAARESIQIGGISLPSGLSVVIIVAVAFVVGSFILCIGIIMFKRRYALHRPAHVVSRYDATAKADIPELMKEGQYMPALYSQSPQEKPAYHQTTQNSGSSQSYNDDRENYAHIWERPLPNPESNISQCPTGSAYTQKDYESQYNTLGTGDPNRPTGQIPVQANQPRVQLKITPGQGNRRMVYGNNTIARKECEIIPPEGEFDPRYFQLDPESMSPEI